MQQPAACLATGLDRQDTKRVDRFERHSRLLVARGRPERRKHLTRYRPRTDRQGAGRKSRFREHLITQFDYQPNPFAGNNARFEEDVQLRGDGLELRLIERIQNRRGHRHGGFRIACRLQHLNGSKSRRRVLAAQIGDGLFEGDLVAIGKLGLTAFDGSHVRHSDQDRRKHRDAEGTRERR